MRSKVPVWPKYWMELKPVVALWRREWSVWKPNVDSGPSPWKKLERILGFPCDGLDPCHWVPCGRWRGESEDLAVCRVYIILWASRRDDYLLSYGEKNGSQEEGLITKAEGMLLGGSRGEILEERNREISEHVWKNCQGSMK